LSPRRQAAWIFGCVYVAAQGLIYRDPGLAAAGVVGQTAAMRFPKRWSTLRRFARRIRSKVVQAATLVAVSCAILIVDYALRTLLLGTGPVSTVAGYTVFAAVYAAVTACFDTDDDSDDHDAIDEASEAVRDLVERVRSIHGPAAVPSAKCERAS
jgi:hypothetical protein